MRDGKADNLSQARADALAQLILEHSDVRVVVPATRCDSTVEADPQSDGTAAPAPAPAAAHADRSSEARSGDDWCEVGGLGAPGTAFVPARWLASISTGTGGLLCCHPVTGALIGGDVPAGLASGRDITGASTRTSSTYRIPAAMVRFVRLRDGGCRFPGCSTPARQCDLDHVRPWPTGPTDPRNLIALCRRHHRVKQRDGWSVRLDADGTTRWTDPSGAVRTTSAIDHLHLGATTAPARTPQSRSRHIDLSLLDEHLSELLDHDRRHPPPRATTSP